MHTLRRGSQDKIMEAQQSTTVYRHVSALAVPGMYLYYKFHEFARRQKEDRKRKITERELEHLNKKIGRLLTKMEDKDSPDDLFLEVHDDECVICLASRATIRTYPCGHRVTCRKCFIKTIQSAVSQRCLPLKCVVCREKILKLKQSAKTQSTDRKANAYGNKSVSGTCQAAKRYQKR